MKNTAFIHLASLELLLFATCLLGDFAVQYSNNQLIKALTDSCCHGVIGVLSWSIVTVGDIVLFEVVLCGALAVIIDLDHFWMAGSMSLQAALSLPHRPPLHNSTIIPIVTVAILIITIQPWIENPMKGFSTHLPLKNCAWIVFIAWSTHHVRDATRRGLWFVPFGSTRPLPHWLYISVILLCPLIVRQVLGVFHHLIMTSSTTVDTSPPLMPV